MKEHVVVVIRVDSPVIIGGAGARCQRVTSEAADAVTECEASVSITGLTYTCSGPSRPHLSSASSLPSLLFHGSDSVVRFAGLETYSAVAYLQFWKGRGGQPPC